MTREERLEVAREFRELNEILSELSQLTLRVHAAAHNAVQSSNKVIEALQEGHES